MRQVINNKKLLIIGIISVLILIVLVVGVTYAFFVYNKVGTKNLSLETGSIKLELGELGDGISLSNQFPMTEANGINQSASYNFSISGYNTGIDPIYYEVIAVLGEDIANKTRYNDDEIKVYITDELGNPKFGPDIPYNLTDGGSQLIVDSIPGGTPKGTPLTRNYILKLWIDAEQILISDTDYVTGKSIYNSAEFQNKYISLKIQVKGDMVPKSKTSTGNYDIAKGVNKPNLAEGMTPIKWDGANWVNTTESDSAWYSYDTTNKKWANAKTADGSMWVWIPRYIYKINPGWHSNTAGTISIQFSKGTNDNWNSDSIGYIDSGTTSNASNNKWSNHPAFTFGSSELTGIWVAKFQVTASEGVASPATSCNIQDNSTSETIKSIPNSQIWRCISINNIFITTRKMETISAYGWSTSSGLQADGSFTNDNNDIDTHLMKNVEWGGILYLSKSQYGQNTNEIYVNNNQNYITGCAGNTVSASPYNGCQNSYESVGGVKASTTGNIYGVYDMSGAAAEYTAAYVNNGHTNITLYGASIANANVKYKDVYTKGASDTDSDNYALTVNKKGDAIWETSSGGISNTKTAWFNDCSWMAETSWIWIVRGWYAYDSLNAGAFAFDSMTGQLYYSSGFRPVIAVKKGL